MGVADGPIAATAARLSALDEYAGFDVGTGAEPGWLALDAIERDGHLDDWLTDMVALHGRRNVAGSLLGSELARAVVGPTVSAIVAEERCPDPALDNYAIRRHPVEGYLDRSAVLRPGMAVLPHDPAADHPDSVVVADSAALDRWWAQRIAPTLSHLLAATKARAPFGLRGLWGAAADEVTGTVLHISQSAGRSPMDAWRRGADLLDALAPYAPVSLVRARLFPVRHSCGEELFQVRGVCCLYYRSTAAEADSPPPDRYCNTCPLRDDDSRHSRLLDYIATKSTPSAEELLQ